MKGTLNLLSICREAQLENILVASSSSVYGNSSRVPYREDDSADRPVSPYAGHQAKCGTALPHLSRALSVADFLFQVLYGLRSTPASGHGFPIFSRDLLPPVNP